ncbi:MAG TPA: hypothetical protein VFR97_06060 [Capillimicrobium sp.]|nr:hypothetical protein [Capillimicrobium sp.]
MTDLQELAIFAIGVLLVLAIGLYIARDARRQAPVKDEAHPVAPEHPRRSEHQRKRDRAKAKAARKARRHNRPR